jgi:hypothetical protein
MEPLYTYNKTKGWIPYVGHLAVSNDGKRCFLINRKPEIGECFASRYAPGDYGTNGNPKMEEFSVLVGMYNKVDFRVTEDFDASIFGNTYAFVTIQWLE